MSAVQVLLVAVAVSAALLLPFVALAVAVWVSWRRECRRQSVIGADLAAARAAVDEAEAIVRAAAQRMHLPG